MWRSVSIEVCKRASARNTRVALKTDALEFDYSVFYES
jgi:hypothetical protein